MPKILNDAPDPVVRELGKKLQRLRQENPAELKRILTQMSPEEAQSILYDEDYWLRDAQRLRFDNPTLRIILLLTGRGFG
ncbi:hypothetical protein M316_0003 [Nitrincola phage 1M3-16]|uniref:hypothetical protein n=1 Tax=Nitrincola phage 1M3-16 TaxID=1472912 RepID=UPI000444CF75|nr:hypothetical protein GJ22_gp003 [Nitrincola phage 1M3-16]AHX01068.1 hypothetical protein M316_0003 [Nitrincola phage 1M3-16]